MLSPKSGLTGVSVSYNTCLLRMMVALSASFAFLSPARADIMVPDGLAAGDQFRLIEGTGFTRDALSDDIAVYDAFAMISAIIKGLASYNGTTINWYALVSTPEVDARDRLPGTGVPIYSCAGSLCDQISTAANDIWDPDPNSLFRGVRCGGLVWTGTASDGTASANPMGHGAAVTVGNCGDASPRWINYAAFLDPSFQWPIYMYSDVITVAQTNEPPVPPAPAPEPTTLALIGIALSGLLFIRRKRHSKFRAR